MADDKTTVSVPSHDPVSVALEYEAHEVELEPGTRVTINFKLDENPLFGYRLKLVFERQDYDRVEVDFKGLLPHSKCPVPNGVMVEVITGAHDNLSFHLSFQGEEFYAASNFGLLEGLLTYLLEEGDGIEQEDCEMEDLQIIPPPKSSLFL
jgi:hypothetical protein